MPKLSTNMRISSSTAQALSPHLVDSILDTESRQEVPNSLAGYDLLVKLALADLQAGNERVKGVAQHVTDSAVKVWMECSLLDLLCYL